MNDYPKLDAVLSDNVIILLFSLRLIDEFVEVAQRPKFKKYFLPSDLQKLLLRTRLKGEFVNVLSEIDLGRYPKDNFLPSFAKDGDATHLITGDKDLLVIKTFKNTKILSIADYLSEK